MNHIELLRTGLGAGHDLMQAPSVFPLSRFKAVRNAGWGLMVACLFGCNDQDETPVDPGDTTPPAVVQDLHPIAVTNSSVTLEWTAPGNDGAAGTASIYDLRYSQSPISEDNWSAASGVPDEPAPLSGGSTQSHIVSGLADSTTYYFALRTFDQASNSSELSNQATATTLLTVNPYGDEDYAVLAGLVRDVLQSIGPLLPALGDFVSREPGENLKFTPGQCPGLAWAVEARQASLSVDYGDGCVAPDSVFRSGSYTLSGEYRASTGLDLSAVFASYVVDDGSEPFEIGGTYEITGTRMSLSVAIDGTITRRIFSSSAVAAAITMDVQSGSEAWDTVFLVEGTASVETEGAVASLSLTQVEWPSACYVPISGLATLRIPMEYLDELGLPGSEDLTVEIDFSAPSYDSPQCDGIALVTIGLYSEEVVLWSGDGFGGRR